MKRVRTIVLVLVVAAMGAPAGAHTTAPSGARSASSRSASRAVALGSAHDRRPARVPQTRNDHVKIVTDRSQADGLLGMRTLGRNSAPLTLQRLRAMQFASLTTPRELGGSGMIPLWPRTAAAAEDDPQTFEGADGFPIPDLDGDGKEDIFVEQFQYTPAPPFTLRIVVEFRSGEDGAHMWSMDPIEIGENGTAGIWVGPILADGGRAVLSYEDNYPYRGDCAIRKKTVDLHANLRMFAAEDGAQLWSKAFDGTMTYRNPCDPLFGLTNVSIESFSGLVSAMDNGPDGTGTGHGGLYVQTSDYSARDISTPVRNFSKRSVATTVQVLDDRDGTSTTGMSISTDGEWPIVGVMPDLSGDGRADLVAVHGGRWSAHSVDGQATYWDEPFQTVSPWYWFAPQSVTSPDSNEIALYTITEDEFDCGPDCYGWIVIFGRDLFVTDAATGTQLWGRRAAPDSPYGSFDWAGMVDGDGGMDFSEVGFEIGLQHVTLGAAAGASGETLWGPVAIDAAQGPDGSDTFVYMIYLGDVNGDGAYDVATGSYTQGGFSEFIQADETAISGKDASTFWALPAFTDPSDLVYGFGDVTDDGRDDVVRVVWGESWLDLAVADGATLDAQFTIPGLPSNLAWLWITDVASAPGNEVLVESIEDTPRGYSATLKLLSRTTPLWTLQAEPQF